MSNDADESMQHGTDHSLIQRLKAGQSSAATALYMRYAQQLRGLAMKQTSPGLASRIDPDDVVQSVFRTFFRRVVSDQYDVPRGEDLWNLFLVMTLNKVRNSAAHHTAAKRDVRKTAALPDDGGGLTQGCEQDLQLLHWVIDETLAEQPASTRDMVCLRIEGYEVAEIAERTKRSKRSVERVLQQFREQLRGRLHDCD